MALNKLIGGLVLGNINAAGFENALRAFPAASTAA